MNHLDMSEQELNQWRAQTKMDFPVVTGRLHKVIFEEHGPQLVLKECIVADGDLALLAERRGLSVMVVLVGATPPMEPPERQEDLGL